MARRILPRVAATAAVLLWSTNAWAAGEVLARTTVLQLLAVQFGSAAVALLLARAVTARGRPVRSLPTARAVSVGVVGLTGTIALQYLAFDSAPLVGANVVCYADGLVAALWVAARRPSAHTLVGVPLALLGFAGVVLVVAGDGGLGGVAPGYLFALGAAAGMAFYSLASGTTGASVTDMLLPATVAGALVTGALSTLRGEVWSAFADWSGAVYIGLGPMAAGYALWTYAMADGRADRLVPLCYLTPLLSTALLLATGRPFTGVVLAGGALILVCSVGVLLSEWHHGRPAAAVSSHPRGPRDLP